MYGVCTIPKRTKVTKLASKAKTKFSGSKAIAKRDIRRNAVSMWERGNRGKALLRLGYQVQKCVYKHMSTAFCAIQVTRKAWSGQENIEECSP